MPDGFSDADWIDRLARALPALAEAQEPYLREYREQTPRTHVVFDGRDGNRPPFPLDDLRVLYAMAHHGKIFGREKHYAPLLAVLDPVRYIMVSHPTLERVVGRIVGKDEFLMEILGSSSSTSLVDLVAGLMARAAELRGDRFRTAAGELNALLEPAGDEGPTHVLGDLDTGYDALLFYGLSVMERVEVTGHMMILPFERVSRFVDQNMVEELALPGAGFHDWRSIGAVVRPFRWRPVFRRLDHWMDLALKSPESFFREAQMFLDLLAVAHTTPIVPLAQLYNCIDRSAGRLLGRERHSPSRYGSSPAHGFNGFEMCPMLASNALAEAKEAFENRKSERYRRMAPTVGRLAAALARNGRFADESRVVDVSIALEGMYDLPRNGISGKLRDRVSCFLGTDTENRERIKEDVKAFYNARSEIVHSRSDKVTSPRNDAAFVKGFDIARRSLFKLLREGTPEDWNALSVDGF